MINQKNLPKLAVIGLRVEGQKYLQAGKELEEQGLLKLWLSCDPQFSESLARFHYQQFDAMLAQESVDIVVLAVPVVYRFQMITQLLAHGIQVIVAGPVATSDVECTQIQSLATKKAVSVVGIQPRFFDSSWMALKETVSKVQAERFNLVLNAPISPSDWRWQNNEAVGVWMSLGYQALEVIEWLFDDIDKVRLIRLSSKSNLPREHTAVAQVTLKNGVVGSVVVSDVPPQQDLMRVKTNIDLFSLVNKKVWQVAQGKADLLSDEENQYSYQRGLENCLYLLAQKQPVFTANVKILQILLNAQIEKSGLSESKANY